MQVFYLSLFFFLFFSLLFSSFLCSQFFTWVKPRNAGFGCSSDCFGASCQSFSGMEGACAFETTDEATCENWGSNNDWNVTFDDPLCIVTSEDMTQSQCLTVSLFFIY